MSRNKEVQELSLPQFLDTDMVGKVILNVTLPPLSNDHMVRTFKVMPRSCNAHAYINAGFCARIERAGDNVRIVGKPTMIFGGLRVSLVIYTHKNHAFNHA